MDKITNGISNLRYSLLTRHHYLPLPSLVITDYYISTDNNLLAEGLFDRLLNKNSNFTINDNIVKERWRFPRWFYLQEICMFYIISELKKWNEDNSQIHFYNQTKNEKDKLIYVNSYIDNCKKLFSNLNNRDINEFISVEPYKTYRNSTSTLPKIHAEEITVKNENSELKLNLGLSNFRLDTNELKSAISNKSTISREKRIKHIKLLNLAEQENIELLILPETSVPFEWLYAYSDESRRKQRAFIFGLEHFTINNFCFNFSISLLPFKTGEMREVMIIPRLKNHYAPKEEIEIRKIGKKAPIFSTSFYHLFKWNSIQFII